MHLLFTGDFSNAFFQTVCWTLIHSLWQGLIAAVIAALIVSLTGRSAAALRYNLLALVLILFVCGVGITVSIQWQSQVAADGSSSGVGPSLIPNLSLAGNATEGMLKDGGAGQNLLERLTAFCNQYASVIVLAWFLLFLVKCSRLLASLRYIQGLRYRNNCAVSPYWKNRLMELAEKTGIRRTITFLESELVKVPAVIGFLKPVLLVPAGLLSNLPPEQVEAILLHELAHIKRRDFIVNFMQSFIETFFFFNPAIAWISSLIRQEREACCDDIVIAGIKQKASYLQALVSFQEVYFHSKTGAMALTGNQHYLLNRVKRMLTQENKKLNLMEKTVLLLGIIGITAFSFMTKETTEIPTPVAAVKQETVRPAIRKLQAAAQLAPVKKQVTPEKKSLPLSLSKKSVDTIPKTTPKPNAGRSFPSISSSINNENNTVIYEVEATDDAGKRYRIKKVDGQITELLVNGNTIPKNQYGEYDEVIRQIEEIQRERIQKKKEEIRLKRADVNARQKELFEKRKALTIANEKERNEKMKLKHELNQQNNVKRSMARKMNLEKNEIKRREYNRKMSEVTHKQKALNIGKKSNDDVGRIITDLNAHKLVADAENLSFRLTNSELVVNGRKQPAEIHKEFKERYILNSNDRFDYSRHGNSTKITINRN